MPSSAVIYLTKLVGASKEKEVMVGKTPHEDAFGGAFRCGFLGRS
jgi:hypothetical protein